MSLVPFFFFCLTNLCFCLNKWQYKILLVQLLRLLSLQTLQICLPKRIKKIKIKNLVKSHRLTSKMDY